VRSGMQRPVVIGQSSVAVVALLLVGCTTPTLPEPEIAQRCHIPPGWTAMHGVPENAPELLAIFAYGTTSVDMATRLPESRAHEQWFMGDAGALLLCRYEYKTRRSCEGSSRSVRFDRADGRWVASPIMFSACVASVR
jgi:hypothetical protein